MYYVPSIGTLSIMPGYYVKYLEKPRKDRGKDPRAGTLTTRGIEAVGSRGMDGLESYWFAVRLLHLGNALPSALFTLFTHQELPCLTLFRERFQVLFLSIGVLLSTVVHPHQFCTTYSFFIEITSTYLGILV